MSSLFKEKKSNLEKLKSVAPYVTISSPRNAPFDFQNLSDNFEELTGYTVQLFEKKHMDLLSIILLEDLIPFKNQYKTAIESNEKIIRIDDFRIIDFYGNLIYVKAFVYNLTEVISLQLSDVSEYYVQIKGNDNIISRYKNLMITLKEGIWDWNIKTNMVYFSNRWRERCSIMILMRFPAHSAIGRKMSIPMILEMHWMPLIIT